MLNPVYSDLVPLQTGESLSGFLTSEIFNVLFILNFKVTHCGMGEFFQRLIVTPDIFVYRHGRQY
jgi:hypothetical protein